MLLGFVFWRTLPLLRRTPPTPPRPPARRHHHRGRPRTRPPVLPVTLAALFAQTSPADTILIADDGSDDGTAALLTRQYGLTQPPPGELSERSATHPSLRWLRLPGGGKARALNIACACANTELVLTVDADTLLEPEALGAMQAAFAADPALVAATGVLTPVCARTVTGGLLQWFQTYEYVRNFLSRYAWMQEDGLLLNLWRVRLLSPPAPAEGRRV